MTLSGGSSGGSSGSGNGSSSKFGGDSKIDKTKTVSAGVSKGASGVSLGETGYQSLISGSTKDGSIVSGKLDKAPTGSTTGGGKSFAAPSNISSAVPSSLIGSAGGGGIIPTGGPVGTTVTQTPAAGNGPEGTTINTSPRSDFSVILAGQVGNRPNRSPARSNNFISLIGGAGGLGRRQAQRTLIGGA
jgi:hypothetical protein